MRHTQYRDSWLCWYTTCLLIWDWKRLLPTISWQTRKKSVRAVDHDQQQRQNTSLHNWGWASEFWDEEANCVESILSACMTFTIQIITASGCRIDFHDIMPVVIMELGAFPSWLEYGKPVVTAQRRLDLKDDKAALVRTIDLAHSYHFDKSCSLKYYKRCCGGSFGQPLLNTINVLRRVTPTAHGILVVGREI